MAVDPTVDVYVTDPSDDELDDMLDYCKVEGLELKMFSCTDISDLSGQWDVVARFTFLNKEDALIFKLKFR